MGVGTHKLILSAMVNASGSLQGAVQLVSTFPNQVTTNFAIVRCLQTHHSAMVLINKSSNGLKSIIAASGASGVLLVFGLLLATGSSHSTSEKSLS